MSTTTTTTTQLSPSNLAIGAAVSLFEVTTLGQPLEVLKTQMASSRNETLTMAVKKTLERGGWKGFYQGLIPWAWIESATTGGILLFTSSLVESYSIEQFGVSKGTAGLLGGMTGGAAQAYFAMGICTAAKTAEITRQKQMKVPINVLSSIPGQPPAPSSSIQGLSTWQFFLSTYRQGGIRAINKGVNAVAVRQVTNWGSRIGIARLAEDVIKDVRGYEREGGMGKERGLSVGDKVLASGIGGALGCWNHPIEVIRVEMQSLKKVDSSKRPTKLTMFNTGKYILQENGIKGLFRGVTPRIGLSTYRTICLVSLGDYVKSWVKKYDNVKVDDETISKSVPTQ